MLVRPERPGDLAAVRAIVATAFARPEAPEQVPIEVTLLDRLRVDRGWLPTFSLVAADPVDEDVVGHVVCSRGWIDAHPALGLGPISVRPDLQRRGVGTALMHAVLGAADALGEPLVALLGDPGYYWRFGFRRAFEYGIAPPDPRWETHFQVRPLSAYQPVTGTFAYADPFSRL